MKVLRGIPSRIPPPFSLNLGSSWTSTWMILFRKLLIFWWWTDIWLTVWTVLFKSLEYILEKVSSFNLNPTNFACSIPVSVNSPPCYPCIIFCLLAKVSPLLIKKRELLSHKPNFHFKFYILLNLFLTSDAILIILKF